mmetsp:Transcript_9243/g.38846  ORF Transcript_9243/g.38846 Transcript_9243/m.38846 type:complete len:243 (-) Transcript_9243:2853-3581(-)
MLSPASSAAGLARRLFAFAFAPRRSVAFDAVPIFFDDGRLAVATAPRSARPLGAPNAPSARRALSPARSACSSDPPATATPATPPPERAPWSVICRALDESRSAFSSPSAFATTRGHARSRKCSCPRFIQRVASRIRYAGSRRHCALSSSLDATPRRCSACTSSPTRLCVLPSARAHSEGFAAMRSRSVCIGGETAPESTAAANAPQPPSSARMRSARRGNAQRCFPKCGCEKHTTMPLLGT